MVHIKRGCRFVLRIDDEAPGSWTGLYSPGDRVAKQGGAETSARKALVDCQASYARCRQVSVARQTPD